MISQNQEPDEPLFGEGEWDAAMEDLTRKMVAHLNPYRAAVYEDLGDDGRGWGSGSYIKLGGRNFILTNEHVANARRTGRQLIHQFAGRDDLFRITGDHIERTWPHDLALLPVDERAWSHGAHDSKTIDLDQISVAHAPVPGELFAFTGFAGERTDFYFGSLVSGATTSLAREKPLPPDDRFFPSFHFGIDYRPDEARDVIGREGLPLPPGLSGSTVWNTCFVEARMKGLAWSPEMAQVTGVVWGWPQEASLLVATRAEHLRSFLLEAWALL